MTTSDADGVPTGSTSSVHRSCPSVPGTATTRVRNASWAASTASRVVRRSSAVSPAGVRTTMPWKNPSIAGPASCSHSVIGVAGIGPTRSAVVSPGASTAVTTVASAAGVGRANRSRGRTRRPAFRAWRTTAIATMLSPPSAKKSSSAPTRSTPRTEANTSQSTCSVEVRGARDRADGSAGNSYDASADRSTLPFVVVGNSGSTANALGTMYSGSRSLHQARSASGVSDGGPAANPSRWSDGIVATITAACRTSG
ncbi:hypothetical protein GCM10020369_66610 [Cryptosporangium minutisporangium]|uniref:Uncharacterized protein n=1 Tax=Cryptosporangium minutisporangium TaxID=113569 RepID=A0ABP6T9G6_9ACTN